jgi:Proteasome regulatory subunit C-terminal
VDHEAGVMVCREAGDVYATAEPAAAFHQRTAFCLDIHNEVHSHLIHCFGPVYYIFPQRTAFCLDIHNEVTCRSRGAPTLSDCTLRIPRRALPANSAHP